MASLEEIESMIGKAFLDTEYRKEILDSPEAAARKMGIELTPEQANAFRAHEVRAVAEQMDKVTSKQNMSLLLK